MAIYVEAIDNDPTPENFPSIFLAGGITGCPDWQSQAVKYLNKLDIIIFNPRRKNFPIDDPNAAHEQILWERNKLTQSSMILFWFCKDTIQPIVLFEYGKYGFKNDKPIFCGVEDGYPRKSDVLFQTNIEKPIRPIFNSLEFLCERVIFFIKNKESYNKEM